MKLTNVLPLAALTTAFVLPPEQVLSELAIEDHHEHTSVIDSWLEAAENTKDEALSSLREHYQEVTETSKKAWEKVHCHANSVLDDAFEKANDAANIFGDKMSEAADDAQSWLEDTGEIDIEGDRHGRRPHRPPHHHKPNETVYQLIAGSKYTTKLAKLISEYDDLVEALNSTKANYTIFAPTDKVRHKHSHSVKPAY